MPRTAVAALVDLDGTLYRGRIWQQLVGHNWASRHQRRWAIAYLARNMALLPLYKLGLMDQEGFYGSWASTLSWLVRGRTVDQAEGLFQSLTEQRILSDLRQEVVGHLRQHQDKGHLVALVSGTFVPWLQAIARRLAVPHVVGTALEERNGHYTGRIVPPLCQGKAKPTQVQAYFAQKGIHVDWKQSYAYADSGTDLPLLRLVGHPVAVQPDNILLAHAQQEGWPVITEAGA